MLVMVELEQMFILHGQVQQALVFLDIMQVEEVAVEGTQLVELFHFQL
jgi:hypothetical protein